MDESAFQTLADRTLQRLFDRIEAALADEVDAELRGGILTLELPDGRQYVINKHAPNRQIWVSSPVSGASHYSHDGDSGQWRSTRDGTSLTGRLARELGELTGAAIAFD
jgi:frataxin